ncbi:MAG: hypothetical protein AB7F43_12605 [Bacteriovoracia bacterium]
MVKSPAPSVLAAMMENAKTEVVKDKLISRIALLDVVLDQERYFFSSDIFQTCNLLFCIPSLSNAR